MVAQKPGQRHDRKSFSSKPLPSLALLALQNGKLVLLVCHHASIANSFNLNIKHFWSLQGQVALTGKNHAQFAKDPAFGG